MLKREVGIGFAFTPSDIESIEFLDTLETDFWKVLSGETFSEENLTVKRPETGVSPMR